MTPDPAKAQAPSDPATQIDDAPGPPRVLVLSDIGNEPDDQMSLVRFLLYTNELDVEGLVATTSTWQRDEVRPDIMHQVLDAYAEVQPTLLRHDERFPSADSLRRLVTTGQPAYGMAAVGEGQLTPGAERIIRAADRDDPRPLWVTVWGGANTLAQALWHVRATRSEDDLDAFVARLRVYSISDQDDAGPWIRRHFPALTYVVSPSTPNGEEYAYATWTGISGDRYYQNAPGADFTTVSNSWLDEHIRSKGPLGAAYPHYLFIMEGDTPSFLNLVANGLAAHRNPGYGGWGGRYVYRQPYGETSPLWTQGGDAFPGNPDSRDTVTGADDASYTSDQATIWRWREAFQYDFAARMDWTIRAPADANHPPEVVVDGEAGLGPVQIEARVGEPVTLSAAGTRDPDGDAVRYTWFYYPEAGPGAPPSFDEGAQDEDVPPDEPWRRFAPGPRVMVRNAHGMETTVMPEAPGESHVILAVEDDGTPSLTAYRRIILDVSGQ